LRKWVHFQLDVEGRELELRYFRDIDGREVDFIVTERSRPLLAVECKLSAGPLDKGLRNFVERFPRVEAWQVCLDGDVDLRTPEGVRLASAEKLLSALA
jgi:predicted AAA+ superfamily ATPase